MLKGEKWDLGVKGESLARRWLQDQGFMVVPTSLIESGGAPMLEGWLHRYVLPDNQAFQGGQGRWVEVKTKSRATFYRKLRRWEHGLPLRHWQDYLAVQNQTGLPAWLCIVELEQSFVLLASMDKLAQSGRVYSGIGMPGGEPHIFFERDSFEWYSEPRAVLIAPISPEAARTVTQKPAPGVRQLTMF